MSVRRSTAVHSNWQSMCSGLLHWARTGAYPAAADYSRLHDRELTKWKHDQCYSATHWHCSAPLLNYSKSVPMSICFSVPSAYNLQNTDRTLERGWMQSVPPYTWTASCSDLFKKTDRQTRTESLCEKALNLEVLLTNSQPLNKLYGIKSRPVMLRLGAVIHILLQRQLI